MIELYGGGPVGLSTLSVNIGEERETVEDMYEPFLIQKGIFKAYTARKNCDCLRIRTFWLRLSGLIFVVNSIL